MLVAPRTVGKKLSPPAPRLVGHPVRCAPTEPPSDSRWQMHKCALCAAAARLRGLLAQLQGWPHRRRRSLLLPLAQSAAGARPAAHLGLVHRAACGREGAQVCKISCGARAQPYKSERFVDGKRCDQLPHCPHLCSSVDRRPWLTTTGPVWQLLTQQLSLTWCSSSPTCGQWKRMRLAGWVRQSGASPSKTAAAAAALEGSLQAGGPLQAATRHVINVVIVGIDVVAATRAVRVARKVQHGAAQVRHSLQTARCSCKLLQQRSEKARPPGRDLLLIHGRLAAAAPAHHTRRVAASTSPLQCGFSWHKQHATSLAAAMVPV